jgi:tRNA1Val (adenine37-N6)-methyltransferase
MSLPTTNDTFLGGRVAVRQPTRGFRAGLDAVMLAAAVPAVDGEEALELGSGVGTASLCLACRVAGATVHGVEIDPDLVALARGNARSNEVDARVSFTVFDALAPPSQLRRPFDHVFCNPPFHADGETSPDAERARALQDKGRLKEWLTAGLKRTGPGGTFTSILRTDRVVEALTALPERGVTVFPFWPRTGEQAKRIIVQVRQGSRAPLVFLPGLVLHEADGRYTPEADTILRQGASLALDSRRL